MKYRGAEIIVRLLEKAGINIITGIPGGSNLPLYHALKQSRIRHVLARHEQGAAFMAQGMARATGLTAVCWATSGPGATNLLTAVADAKMDSVPVIFITGQVPSRLMGTDAFQEVDIARMAQPVTKKVYAVKKAEQLLSVLPESFKLANSGKPGPVLIDIPKDIQLQEIDIDALPEMPGRFYQGIEKAPRSLSTEKLKTVAKMIQASRKPVLYIGGGAVNCSRTGLIQKLAEKNSIPVTTSLMGLGAMPHDHPLFLGMLGMHGRRFANLALRKCDLLIAMGARFSDRSTGNIREFCPEAGIIHVDVNPDEMNKIKLCDCGIVAEMGEVLGPLISCIKTSERKGWLAEISRLKAICPPGEPPPDDPNRFIRRIGRAAGQNAIITTDVGQHQMWAAQSYPFRRPRTFLTSGGLGTMGFGLPAAIGAALENPDRLVICVSGDGSLLMNIQELATLSELQCNVKIILMNNRCLGLVRQQQELFYQKQYTASVFQESPDFAGIARGFGLKAKRFDHPDIPEEYLEYVLHEKGPFLLEVAIDPRKNVFPVVVPGAGNYKMIVGSAGIPVTENIV